ALHANQAGQPHSNGRGCTQPDVGRSESDRRDHRSTDPTEADAVVVVERSEDVLVRRVDVEVGRSLAACIRAERSQGSLMPVAGEQRAIEGGGDASLRAPYAEVTIRVVTDDGRTHPDTQGVD